MFKGILTVAFFNYKCFIVNRQSRTYHSSTSSFLTLQWCKSDMHSVETILRILIFSWASGYAVWSSHDAGQWQGAAVPSQAGSHKGEQPEVYNVASNAL